MKAVDGLHLLLVSAILCAMVQTAAAQSSAKAEVLAALAERDKAFVAGEERRWWSLARRIIFRPM